MDIHQIDVFHAVMTTGTATRAAELLRSSQPAVSKSLMALEKSVGFRLFDRVKGRLIPTPEGQLFFREVEPCYAGMAKLRGAAARIRDFGSGDLRLGCLSAFSTTLVPVALRNFTQRHPKVSITLQVLGSSAIRDMVAEGRLDIGITSDEVDTTGLDVQPYLNPRAALAVYPGHPLAGASVIRPADLHEVSFVALAPEDTTRREADGMFSAQGVAPRIVCETAFSSSVCALVLAGLGCGIVDPVTALGFVERGLILKPLEPELRFRTLLLFPPDRQRSRQVQDLVSELRALRIESFVTVPRAT